MAKARDTSFFCTSCGFESPKWSGQCPACGEWNTMVEAPVQKEIKAQVRRQTALSGHGASAHSSRLSEIELSEKERTLTGIEEFDRVLGGGIIPGSLILVGGDPGIGKSTLLTQVCRILGDKGVHVLYISGEESLRQIKLRAERLGAFSDNVSLMCESDLDVIEKVINDEKPQVCVIDSIQTMFRPDVSGAPGSIGQVRESTAMLMQLAKGSGVTIFVVGHVTKEGVVAGPRLLEHMVDTVLYFEGDSQGPYRILRGVKNRFGSTNEIGVFEMTSEGLAEVPNPSESMLSGRPADTSGSIVSCSLEGTRPILVEIQALVARSVLGNPRRSATGLDYNRLNLLVAVLEKRLGLRMSEADVYVNIVGGLKVTETALDLAVAMAMASSTLDLVVPADIIAIGEIGLSGEVRNISQMEARVNEAAKMGFSRCILPHSAVQSIRASGSIQLIGVSNLREAISILQ